MNFGLELVPQVAIFLIVAVSALPAISTGRMLVLGVSGCYTVGAFVSVWFDAGQPGGTASMVIGALGGGLAGAFLAAACLRLRGDYFALASLCFAEVVRLGLLINPPFPGPQGIAGVPRGTLLGFSIESPEAIATAALLCLGLISTVTTLTLVSPWAAALRATSDNERAARTNGLPTNRIRSTALVYMGLGSGIAGALGTRYLSLADANTFSLPDSILVLVVLLLAGAPSVWRCIVFGTLVSSFSEVLRFIATGAIREIAFAALLVAAALVVRDDLRNQDTLEALP